MLLSTVVNCNNINHKMYINIPYLTNIATLTKCYLCAINKKFVFNSRDKQKIRFQLSRYVNNIIIYTVYLLYQYTIFKLYYQRIRYNMWNISRTKIDLHTA